MTDDFEKERSSWLYLWISRVIDLDKGIIKWDTNYDNVWYVSCDESCIISLSEFYIFLSEFEDFCNKVYYSNNKFGPNNFGPSLL